jgi:hypothetical protein
VVIRFRMVVVVIPVPLPPRSRPKHIDQRVQRRRRRSLVVGPVGIEPTTKRL